VVDDFTLWIKGMGDVTLKATVNGYVSLVRLKLKMFYMFLCYKGILSPPPSLQRIALQFYTSLQLVR